MDIKCIGHKGQSPVFLAQSSNFGIREFAFEHVYSNSPILILKGEDDEVIYGYHFILVHRAGDIIEDWNNGKMDPFAVLSDEDYTVLLHIGESKDELFEKDRKIAEILNRNTINR